MTDASNPERLRLLQGEDPTCAELREKLEKLQVTYTALDHQQPMKPMIGFNSANILKLG